MQQSLVAEEKIQVSFAPEGEQSRLRGISVTVYHEDNRIDLPCLFWDGSKLASNVVARFCMSIAN